MNEKLPNQNSNIQNIYPKATSIKLQKNSYKLKSSLQFHYHTTPDNSSHSKNSGLKGIIISASAITQIRLALSEKAYTHQLLH